MRHISFAYTTGALLTGNKSVTRRDWKPDYARLFMRNQLVAAYDRSPRAHGSHIAVIQLTDMVRLRPMSEMPDEDYEAEGFAWMLAHPEVLPATIDSTPRDHFIRTAFTREGFESWRQTPEQMWVVRFNLVSLTEEGERQKQEIERKIAEAALSA